MAVKKKILEKEADQPQKISLEVDNGDLEAINEVMRQYGFVNEQALLRYVLFSLIQSSDNKLYIKSGDKILSVNIDPSLVSPNKDE